MKKLIFIVFVLLIFSILNAEEFTLGDFKNPEFQRHCMGAIALTALTHKTCEMFTTHTIRKEWWDEEGYHLTIYKVEDQKWMVLKYCLGIGVTAIVCNITNQEDNPDARAMYVGTVGYTGFCLGLNFLKRGWK